MRTPNCPQHGDQVLMLALGELDATAAERATEALRTCPACSEWHRAELELPEVAAGVAAGLQAFSPPWSAGRRGRVLAALAAAVLMVVGGVTAHRVALSGAARGPEAAALPALQPEPAVRSDLSAPTGDPQKPEAWMQALIFPTQQQPQQPIFADRMESASLSAWSEHN